MSVALNRQGDATSPLDLANDAVRYSPADAEARLALANALSDDGKINEVGSALEQAVALRPHDHRLWLKLGESRNAAGDTEGALAAYKEAVRLAPFYSTPRGQLGNLLVRMGRIDEGFAELRRAALSDPQLAAYNLYLAWGLYDGEASLIERALQPQTAVERYELARLFAKGGKVDHAMRMFRETKRDAAAELSLRALLTDLLASKRFPEAYEVWAGSSSRSNENLESLRAGASGAIFDPGFESKIRLDDPGFGWQVVHNLEAVRAGLDRNAPRAGAQSLRLDFSGDSNPSAPVVSQLVLAAPRARYNLSFAARTQEIVTGGLPILVIYDASVDGRVLTQTNPFPQGTSAWQDYTVEFATGEETNAVVIALQRQGCPGNARCPIFGRIWFDDFALRKL